MASSPAATRSSASCAPCGRTRTPSRSRRFRCADIRSGLPDSALPAPSAENSSNASGLPYDSRWTRERSCSGRWPATSESNRAAAASSSGPRRMTVGNESAGSGDCSVLLEAATSRTRSAGRRGAAKSSASTDVRSIQCRSSTKSTTVPWALASSRSPRTATPSTRRSGAGPLVRPKATSSADACRSGRASMYAVSGVSSSCSAPNARSVALLTPRARRTKSPRPPATTAASARSAVFPMPGSPSTRTALP
ncbi:hypothetical protein QE359_001498 [Curtobacterium sp. SORGH_AS776]|nr:hypothetical protein [Curtobacterium sp. SORGH_AS_0776]